MRESWPVVRDADELHDALLTLVWVPCQEVSGWQQFVPELTQSGRAVELAMRDEEQERRGWVATENVAHVESVLGGGDGERTVDAIVQGWMESIGPTTTGELADRLHLAHEAVNASMVRLESQGQVLRGQFRPAGRNSDFKSQIDHSGEGKAAPEWCHRRLLARIHRLTIGKLRREVEPVSAAEFMRFLFQWQHLASGSRQHGEAGLLEVIRQLAGFEAAASSWDSQLLREEWPSMSRNCWIVCASAAQ